MRPAGRTKKMNATFAFKFSTPEELINAVRRMFPDMEDVVNSQLDPVNICSRLAIELHDSVLPWLTLNLRLPTIASNINHINNKLVGIKYMLAYLQNLIEQWNAWGIEKPFPALLAALMVLVFIAVIFTTIMLIISDYISKKLANL